MNRHFQRNTGDLRQGIYLEIPLKESVNELNEVIIRARTNKEEAMNKMATTGARMLSVEEASRYAGGFDDPHVWFLLLPEWLPVFLPMEFLFMAMHLICCNGDWRMSKFLIRITLRISLRWVEESFLLLVHKCLEIPISSPEHFLLNMEMLYPESST